MYEIFKEYLNGIRNTKDEYERIDEILNNIKRAFKLYQKKPKYTDKNKKIIRNTNKFINGIEQIKILIDNDNFRIPGKYYAQLNNNVDLDWMNDKDRFENIVKETGADYMKGNNDNELKLIKNFITKINNGTINKNNAGN